MHPEQGHGWQSRNVDPVEEHFTPGYHEKLEKRWGAEDPALVTGRAQGRQNALKMRPGRSSTIPDADADGVVGVPDLITYASGGGSDA